MVDFYLGSGTVDDRVYPRGQGFGPADPDALQFYGYHTGYDAQNPEGTSLTAAWPGLVETSRWSDSIGDNVSVIAGHQFEGLFMEAGFSYAYAHMSSLSVESGVGVIANQLIGLSGHEGTMVVGQPGDHNHLSIANENYGRNQYLTDVLQLGDSSSFDKGRWTWPVDRSKRFYDPRFAYENWFRR
jgi:murein DD-endopeptidase MepM/ murein hydrolase activator NlpD